MFKSIIYLGMLMKRSYFPLVLWFVADVALVVMHYVWRRKLGFFDLDREGNLASVYSGFKLIATGGFAFVLAWLASIARARLVASLWALAGVGFVFIGLDDMMAIHERVGFVLNNWTGLGGFYGESFNWLIYFAPLVALALLVYAKLIQSVWRASRANALWMLAGAILFVLSLAVEVIGARLILAPHVNVRLYWHVLVVEELLEMAGATCFFIGIARETRRRFSLAFTRIPRNLDVN